MSRRLSFVPNVEKYGRNVPLPIKVQGDNVGAIWLENNNSVSVRTKHVDSNGNHHG